MAKERTLKAALDRHKGVNHKIEHQKQLQKKAGKRKRQQSEGQVDGEGREDAADGGEEEATIEEEEVVEALELAQGDVDVQRDEVAAKLAQLATKANGHGDGWETDDSEDEDGGAWIELGAFEDESDSDSEDEILANGEHEAAEEDQEEDDIPLSDIESLTSEERGDVIPHQRLTINNTAALQRSLKSIALPPTLPFSATQSVTSAEPVQIADVEDDLTRELAFYKQSLDAVKEARIKLKKEGIPFSRPSDYFAEMVKSEEQMGKVRQKVVDEVARKKASSDARRQRDLKKFGKAVQVAKLQERDRSKRDTLEKISTLKRKRQGAELNANEGDMFDVALEDATVADKADRAARRAKGGDRGGRGATGEAGQDRKKRQKKDEKFGFGGKKRFAKSNDARSTGEMTGFSARKMKGGAKAAKQRPGKARRAKMG